MTIDAASSADLLCRLIGLLAQRDLAAPGMTVDIARDQMTVTVDLADLDDRTASLLAEKMARCIGVEAITIDGVPFSTVFLSDMRLGSARGIVRGLRPD